MMNKILALAGVLAASGGLSICDLCGISSPSALQNPQFELLGAAAPITLKTVTFKVSGMTCGGCVYAVRKVLTRLPGVSKADVSYERSRAVVTYDPAIVTISQIVAAIKTLGYAATVIAPSRG